MVTQLVIKAIILQLILYKVGDTQEKHRILKGNESRCKLVPFETFRKNSKLLSQH